MLAHAAAPPLLPWAHARAYLHTLTNGVAVAGIALVFAVVRPERAQGDAPGRGRRALPGELRGVGHKHKKPPQLQPCNGRWLNGGGIWGVRPSGFTREGLRMHRATCAVVGSESLPTHAGRLLVWYGVSPLKNRGYSSFSARRPHQVHLDRMALIPPNALPTLRPGRRGPLRGPHPPGVRPRTRGCPRGGDVHLPPCADSAGGG